MFEIQNRKFNEDGVSYDRITRNVPRNLVQYYSSEPDMYADDREYDVPVNEIFGRPQKISHEFKDKNFFGEDLNENGEIGPPVTWTTASDPRWIAAKETYHRLTNNHNASLNATMYKVQFKNSGGNFFFDGPNNILPIGEYVIVEADRGEDLGVITGSFPWQDYRRRKNVLNARSEAPKIGRILRVASPLERSQLPAKNFREKEVLQVCRDLAENVHKLPIMVEDAVFQFDGHKITVYYSYPHRVDFREFVRDLHAIYKARIWMEKVPDPIPIYGAPAMPVLGGQFPRKAVEQRIRTTADFHY